MNRYAHLRDVETAFIAQSEPYLKKAMQSFSVANLSELDELCDKLPEPLSPVLVNDYRSITRDERDALARQFLGRTGVAYFIVLNPDDSPRLHHPLHDMAAQLADILPLRYPIPHPLENHPHTVSTFGNCDGTVKIYRVPDKGVALGTDGMAMHQDGLGSGGTVEAAALYADSGGLGGGFTCFQNLVLASLLLAHTDRSAFDHLFLPDALTVHRTTGSRALKITGPVLFLGETANPQLFFRVPDGEYQVRYRDEPALERGISFLFRFARPLANGSTFVHLSNPGHGCYVRNQVVVHGRTRFVDSQIGARRVLARKWYASESRHAFYRHAPGLFLDPTYGVLFPDLAAEHNVRSEWQYNDTLGSNVRVS
ncbi:MAG TPA: hypothetical protein VMF91_20405 [Bryobacteraceae bacterium]|nr:hypothetical protein [Bryobacteraceae bacterium]